MMDHSKDGLPVVFLLLTLFCGGGSLPIDPPQLVTAMVGDDVVLPCQLDPPVDAVAMTMEWGRADMKPRFVLVWHNGKELLAGQNQAFKGRASLSISGLQHGDVSLMLSSVKVSDSGTYRCYLQELNQKHQVQLLVGASSSPAISLAGLHLASSAVVLHCESRGWYPEPEMLWMDSEGKLLSAGPPETLRGPGDLYSVSSSVTVEKRHGNIFTCRVQQRNINQTRETLITVPDDFFMTGCTLSVAFSVVFAFLFVIAVVLLLWRWRQNITDTTTQQPLMEEERRKEEVKNMEEDLKKKEEEQKDLMQVIDTLTEGFKALIEQKQKVQEQITWLQKQDEENEEKVVSVERDETEKTEGKGQGHLKMRRIITENNWKLQKRKEELQLLSVNLDIISKKSEEDLKRFKERKKSLDIDVEKIKKHLEEIQRKLSEKEGGDKRGRRRQERGE
ncbi:butyrophilin subfamily 3 member A2-like [Pungitius pungitius]|uniref:butyrophilin subfamily 3 member A2-like n=1 Tax=Pungitius pungitius TaxID=134920 RepID=UPI002E1337D9